VAVAQEHPVPPHHLVRMLLLLVEPQVRLVLRLVPLSTTVTSLMPLEFMDKVKAPVDMELQ
jgi:hypothetical protein